MPEVYMNTGRSVLKFSHACLAIAAVACASTSARATTLPVTTEQRLENVELKKAIMGALLYLDDTQIRQRHGLHDPRVDACSGDGCLPLVPGTGQALPLPLPFTHNRKGEW